MLKSLAKRERIPELMDDPDLAASEHARALRGLTRLNRISGATESLWKPLANLSRKLQRKIQVLDVACGAGDTVIALANRARRHKLPILFSGCDLSPSALDHASRSARQQHLNVNWFRHNAVTDRFPQRYDVIMTSLFLHHLSEPEVITLLGEMKESATQMILVNDLARSRLNYRLVWLGCRLLSRSSIVHFDGPASVRSAFTADELAGLAQAAGLSGARVRAQFPCRLQLEWQAS